MELGLALFALLVAGYALVAVRLQRLSVSPALAFVVIGILLSEDFLGILAFDPEAESVKLVAEVTLALVLFGDASSVDLRRLSRDAGPVARLLVPGLLLTIVFGAIAALGLFHGITLGLAVLIAASLAPTDAALGQPVISDKRVPARIRRILNVESGLNDGIATPFVLLALGFAATEATGSEGWIADSLVEGTIGVIAGIVLGVVGGWALVAADRRRWTSPQSRQLAVLALSVGSYFVAVAAGGNGFIAAFVGGLAFGVATRRRSESAVAFTETQGSILAIIVWTIFGITVGGALIARGLDVAAIIYAVISLTVVRMVPVALALIGCRFQPATVAFIGWFGPRGLASIVFLIIALEGLRDAGQGTEALIAAIGWTVLLSVVLHGLTAVPLAKRYGAHIAATAGDIPEREPSDEPQPTRTHWGAADSGGPRATAVE
jgi:NhaP-type Na+/H+ or K+/H+ antiporter